MSRFPWLDGVVDDSLKWASDVAEQNSKTRALGNPNVSIRDQLVGIGEAGLQMGNEFVQAAGSGIAGLGVLGTELAQGSSMMEATNEAADTIKQSMSDPLWVFEAETPVGKATIQTLEKLEQPIVAAAEWGAGKAADAGHPALATGIHTLGEAIPEMVLGKGLAATGNAVNRFGNRAVDEILSNAGTGPRSGSPQAQEGALKITGRRSDGSEQYASRSASGVPETVAEELVVARPPVMTREADLKQETSKPAGSPMFGSSIPEAMRMVQRQSGPVRAWKKDLERQGVKPEEISFFMESLNDPDGLDRVITRDEFFDIYENAPAPFIGVRRSGEGTADGSFRKIEDEIDALLKTERDGVDAAEAEVAKVFSEDRAKAIDTSKQLSDIKGQIIANESNGIDSYELPDGRDGTFNQYLEQMSGRMYTNGAPDAVINKTIAALKDFKATRGKVRDLRAQKGRIGSSGGGPESSVARNSMNRDWRYKGGEDKQTWLYNERIDPDEGQGSMKHFGKQAVAAGEDIEGDRVANLAHMRTDRRGVFAESYVDELTGETKWREVKPFTDESGAEWRPAAQHMGEGQSDTHALASQSGYARDLTPMEVAEMQQYQQAEAQFRARRERAEQELVDLRDKYGRRNPAAASVGSGVRANQLDEIRDRLARQNYNKLANNLAGIRGLKNDQEAINEYIQDPSLTQEEIMLAQTFKDHVDESVRIEEEFNDARTMERQAREAAADLQRIAANDTPSLALKTPSQRFRFFVRDLVEEAVRNGDEYVTVTSMRQQGEVYSYGGLGPEEGSGTAGGGGDRVFWDDDRDEFRTTAGDEVDVDDIPDDVVREAELNAPAYHDWRDEASEAWLDERETELVNNGDVYEVTEYEFDGEYYDDESDAERAVTEQWDEENPEPDEDDYVDEDDYAAAVDEWHARRDDEVDYDVINQRTMIVEPDGEYHDADYDTVESVARGVAEHELHNGYIDDDDLASALGETWDDRLEESAVEWKGGGSERTSLQLPDPDYGLMDKDWEGSDGGTTETMAKLNYSPEQVDRSLRRVLRDMGLSEDQILKALVRVNIDVSGAPDVGRQQNVKAIKITDDVKEATQNKAGLFSYDPVRTHGKQPSRGQVELFGKPDTAADRARDLAKQHDRWKEKNVRSKSKEAQRR